MESIRAALDLALESAVAIGSTVGWGSMDVVRSLSRSASNLFSFDVVYLYIFDVYLPYIHIYFMYIYVYFMYILCMIYITVSTASMIRNTKCSSSKGLPEETPGSCRLL